MGGTCIPRHKLLWAATAAASIAVQVRAAAELPALGGPPSRIPILCSDTPILFDPEWVPGRFIDILSHDVVEKIYTEPMVKQYSSAACRARGPILARKASISREAEIRPNRALQRISSAIAVTGANECIKVRAEAPNQTSFGYAVFLYDLA